MWVLMNFVELWNSKDEGGPFSLIQPYTVHTYGIEMLLARALHDLLTYFNKNKNVHGLNPQAPGKGENSLPHSRAIFSKLKNEDKDLFSFRNCKKRCKKAQNAIISLSFPSYENWQPPENRLCIGERARREVAWRGFGSPQVVVYEWIRLGIVLPYAEHLFSMTQTLLLRFCSNEAREMEKCL